MADPEMNAPDADDELPVQESESERGMSPFVERAMAFVRALAARSPSGNRGTLDKDFIDSLYEDD